MLKPHGALLLMPVCATTRQAEEFTDAVIGFMGNLPAVPPLEEAGGGGGSGLAGLMQVCSSSSLSGGLHRLC